jgi:hypothetical protein
VLKDQQVKNGVKTLELPMLDYVFDESENNHPRSNHRDYWRHPSTMQKYNHRHKFRNLVSDHQ